MPCKTQGGQRPSVCTNVRTSPSGLAQAAHRQDQAAQRMVQAGQRQDQTSSGCSEAGSGWLRFPRGWLWPSRGWSRLPRGWIRSFQVWIDRWTEGWMDGRTDRHHPLLGLLPCPHLTSLVFCPLHWSWRKRRASQEWSARLCLKKILAPLRLDIEENLNEYGNMTNSYYGYWTENELQNPNSEFPNANTLKNKLGCAKCQMRLPPLSPHFPRPLHTPFPRPPPSPTTPHITHSPSPRLPLT